MSGGRRRREAGLTLMEVLIAVTLLSLLTLGMMFAMRLGLQAFARTDNKLMENRRVAGAQRVLEQELQGLIPVVAPCGGSPGGAGLKFGFFQGRMDQMSLISSFSLQGGWRGQPQILQLFVIPGENGEGVRLVVNETRYTGAEGAGQFCMGFGQEAGVTFAAPAAGPKSFVLADKLAYCRFSYMALPKLPQDPRIWTPIWATQGWPIGIRVEMAPLTPNPARLQPITVIAPLYLYRSPEVAYSD
jgi:type II secretory pathway component PulJ